MPAVERRYRTYAESTDEAGLEASRNHRAFGGFSMGAVTTWYQLVNSLDYVAWFMPLSGDCWEYGNQGGASHPEETARYLNDVVASARHGDDLKRPYVICHILSALDGKITGEFMGTRKAREASEEYARIREAFHADAWLYGAVTTKEFTQYRKAELDTVTKDVPDGDFIAEKSADFYYISVDSILPEASFDRGTVEEENEVSSVSETEGMQVSGELTHEYETQELYAQRDENQIYGLLYIPKDAGEKMPAVIFSHGFGGNHQVGAQYSR